MGAPAGDDAHTFPGLSGAEDAWEPPAQLDRGRQLAALLIGGTDGRGLFVGHGEHVGEHGPRRMGSASSMSVAASAIRRTVADALDAGDSSALLTSPPQPSKACSA